MSSLHSSSKATPCPVCSRTHSDACRWTDEAILCNPGDRCHPPEALQLGDLVDVDGAPWALVSFSGGYSGSAWVFRPHRPASGPHKALQRIPDPRAMRHVLPRAEAFCRTCCRAVSLPCFEASTLEELRAARQIVAAAQAEGEALLATIDAVLAEVPRARVLRPGVHAALKHLAYQAADLELFWGLLDGPEVARA